MTVFRSLLIAVTVLLLPSFSSGADERPNIVFIFTDDHCQQALSAYDDSRMTTPNWRAFAAIAGM